MDRRILFFSIFLLIPLSPLSGHEGPPFPIVVDWKIASMSITIWADPDVGTGTFFIAVEQPTNESLEISMDVQPVDKKIPKKTYIADLKQKDNVHRYYAEVDFPTEEVWNVDIKIGYHGKEQSRTVPLTVTPPGLGSSLDIVWYLVPFALFGFFYLLSAIRPGGSLRRLFRR